MQDCSHGFRPGHSPHQARQELRAQGLELNIGWIVDADVSGFFDSLDHDLLREVIRKRGNDGAYGGSSGNGCTRACWTGST